MAPSITTAETLAEDLAVHPVEVMMIIETIADLHYDEIPPVIEQLVRETLNPAGERDCPPLPPLPQDLAQSYRESPDPALLDELRMHGCRLGAHALLLERLLSGPEAAAYSTAIDAWLDGGPQPYVQHTR